MSGDPFEALGLPARPDLADEEVSAAWRSMAAATHPDRSDGGDPARYARASAAYAELRAPWGRTEAYADVADQAGPDPARRWRSGPTAVLRWLAWLPARIRHGRPGRLLIRAALTLALCLAARALIGGRVSAAFDIGGLIGWLAVAARWDLAPPPER